MSDVEDLIGDPLTIEEIIEAEAERDMERYVQNDDEEQEENNENAIPQLPTEPQGTAIDPRKKRVVKNRQATLNPARLMGPRGIIVLEQVFKDFEFNGKGFEKLDLNKMMKKMEHWAHRLFPKFKFDDCIQKIETLGTKKEVKTYLKKIRMGLASSESVLEEEIPEKDEVSAETPIDAFDELLSQQLSEIQKTISPAPVSTQSSSSNITLTAEQHERMVKNRLIAEQRRLERMKTQHDAQTTSLNSDNIVSNSDNDQSQSLVEMNLQPVSRWDIQSSENLKNVASQPSGKRIDVQVEVYNQPNEGNVSICNTNNISTLELKDFDIIQTDIIDSKLETACDSGAVKVSETLPLDKSTDTFNMVVDNMNRSSDGVIANDESVQS